MTCPGDHYIPGKEIEKIVNYSALRVDAEKLWNIHAKIVSVVIETLESTLKTIYRHLDIIRIALSITTFAKTTNTLQKVLAVCCFET